MFSRPRDGAPGVQRLMRGTVFDIKEFSLNDGEGIRTTVFMKGCPLSCVWCHNPEGLSPSPELYVKKASCSGCGLCKRPCNHEDCRPYGRCLRVCPRDLVTVVGREWESGELCTHLLKQADFLRSVGGGVTFSGGEPLMQSEFVAEVLDGLCGRLHRAVETSGFSAEKAFERVISKCDFVYMDLKLFNCEAHRKFCGVSNERILKNAKLLMESGVEHCFRVPLVPGITDTEENLSAIADFVGDSRVELLPYNPLAPAKYAGVGRSFSELIDGDKAVSPRVELFKNAKVR